MKKLHYVAWSMKKTVTMIVKILYFWSDHDPLPGVSDNEQAESDVEK
jgi:hypothetical protein